MKRNRQAVKYIVSDFVSAAVVWFLFNWLRFEEMAMYEVATSFTNYLTYIQVLKGQLFVPFFWLILYYFSGYYNKPLGKSRLTELFSTFVTVLIGVVFIFFVVVLNDLPRSFHIYYELFFALLGLQFFMTYIPRLIITQSGLRKIKSREWAMNVLIIGAGARAARIAGDLYRLGFHISGFIPEDEVTPLSVKKEEVVGTLSDLASVIADKNIDELVLAAETDDDKKQLTILYSLYYYGLPIKVLADKLSMLSQVKIKTIRGIPLVNVTENNLSAVEKNIKYVMDKVLSALVLVLLSPMYLYIAWRVKKDSPGPVFFRQERIGYMGKPFYIYKFRTMYIDAEDKGPLLASEKDKRITPFGHVLRKYRLDEFPQFWNVLKGDMSIVGPRPERKFFIDQIVKKAPYYYLLHNVRPGITSLGMVKYGYANDVDKMIERLKYDVLYYENMSLVLDITILIFTVRTVFTGKGI
ncbi:sugar transferase [Parabacteroides sp. TM07-1AC]|uniref:sugar transferase n=1 Tax=Parabacteroides sp. TM07-1AC TaxID=2292363 RepID=UPI000EFE031D|nr:sugar transferase [Parabacteroides sp. TM07-1AC]RHU30685.1 sugar transferase [Parabacteroides sp. TM07-1AC]